MSGELVVAISAAWLTLSAAGVTAWAALRSAQRRRHEDQAIALTRPLHCLCCPGAPVIVDYAAHTRLCHQPRELALEDSAYWGTR